MAQHFLSDMPTYMWSFMNVLRNHSMQYTTTPGTTWIELMILSVCHCNDPMPLLYTMTGFTRSAICPLLNEFRLNAMKLVDYARDDEQHAIFASSHDGLSRLQGLGTSTRLLHTSAYIYLRPTAATMLSACLLSMDTDVPQAKMNTILGDQTSLNFSKFDGTRPFKGRRYTTTCFGNPTPSAFTFGLRTSSSRCGVLLPCWT